MPLESRVSSFCVFRCIYFVFMVVLGFFSFRITWYISFFLFFFVCVCPPAFTSCTSFLYYYLVTFLGPSFFFYFIGSE